MELYTNHSHEGNGPKGCKKGVGKEGLRFTVRGLREKVLGVELKGPKLAVLLFFTFGQLSVSSSFSIGGFFVNDILFSFTYGNN